MEEAPGERGAHLDDDSDDLKLIVPDEPDRDIF